MLLWEDVCVDADLRCARCFCLNVRSIPRRECEDRIATHLDNFCLCERFPEDVVHASSEVTHDLAGFDIRGNSNDGGDAVELADRGSN